MATRLPGGRLDAASLALMQGVSSASNILSAHFKEGAAREVVGHGIDIANIRARYYQDSTVQDRVDRILAQQFIVAEMAQATHDALLPDNVGGFQDADSAINRIALALAAEMRAVIASQSLVVPDPAVLANADVALLGTTLDGLGAIDLGQVLAFTPNGFMSGAIRSVGESRILGNPKFGVDPAWPGVREMSRAEALGLADVEVELVESVLQIVGRAEFGVGGELLGSGVARARSWLFEGGQINPGDSPGKLTLRGEFTMESGRFRMEIAGDEPGAFDQVVFLDSVHLRGGTVRVIVDRYHPEEGDSVRMFLADGRLDFSRMRVDVDGLAGLDGSLQPDGRIYFGLPDHLGTEGADRLRGGKTPDTLLGLFGADRLAGGPGPDRLIGGPHADIQRGGFGADTFIFLQRADFGGRRAFDLIVDFEPGRDRLDLSAIDADSSARGNQAFTFIDDDRFDRTPGQLRYVDGVVTADIDGDRTPDFRLNLASAPELHAGDILL